MSIPNQVPLGLVKWSADIAEDDYGEAMRKMTLRFNKAEAEVIVANLRKASIIKRRAKDILDAVRLPPLPMSDPVVHKQMILAIRGDKISPILLTQQPEGIQMVDGYHRLSFAYHIDEFGDVPLKIG